MQCRLWALSVTAQLSIGTQPYELGLHNGLTGFDIGIYRIKIHIQSGPKCIGGTLAKFSKDEHFKITLLQRANRAISSARQALPVYLRFQTYCCDAANVEARQKEIWPRCSQGAISDRPGC